MAYLGRKGASAALTSADIPDNSITAAKIVEGTITVGDIGTDAVGADELANDAVDTNAIANDAVTGGKLANDIAISTTGAITTTGAFTSVGIDDNADATAITIDSSKNVKIANTPSSLVNLLGASPPNMSSWGGYTLSGTTSNSQTTTGAGGVVNENLFRNLIGKTYRYHFAGTSDIGCSIWAGGAGAYTGVGIPIGTFSVTGDYTHVAGDKGGLYIRHGGAGTTTFTAMTVNDLDAGGDLIVGNEIKCDSLSTAGNLTVNTGNLVIGTAGKGITFSSTNTPAQSSGTGTHNTLDDYEEGTWTCTVTSATPPSTLPTGTGYYTKIGRLVNVAVRVNNANTTGGSGAMQFTGLPFSQGATNGQGHISMHMMSRNVDTILTVWFSGTVMNPYETFNNGSWTLLNITAGSGKYFEISGSYQTG